LGEYLTHSKKNKFGIWNYDGTKIPAGWAKHYQACTRVLPSSSFSFKTFKNAGIPEDIMTLVPHGASEEYFTRDDVFPIHSDRKYKFFLNIAQPHTRKNLPGLLDAWGKAFTNKDDVVLVAKVSIKEQKMAFDVSWTNELAKMKKKYPKHAPIIPINQFVEYMSDLYRACDIGISLSHVECFNLPALESMACKKITIASNYGGNVDFMNEENSLLVNGKIGRAPMEYQYWSPHAHGEMFYPDTNHAVEQMQRAVKEYDSLSEKFAPKLEEVRRQYTWDNAVKQILSLVK